MDPGIIFNPQGSTEVSRFQGMLDRMSRIFSGRLGTCQRREKVENRVTGRQVGLHYSDESNAVGITCIMVNDADIDRIGGGTMESPCSHGKDPTIISCTDAYHT